MVQLQPGHFERLGNCTALFNGCRAVCRLAICRLAICHINNKNENMPTRNLTTSIFLDGQNLNVIDVLTTLTLFFHDVQ